MLLLLSFPMFGVFHVKHFFYAHSPPMRPGDLESLANLVHCLILTRRKAASATLPKRLAVAHIEGGQGVGEDPRTAHCRLTPVFLQPCHMMVCYPETKVIMLTAYATLDATIEAIRERIYAFLKPVKIEELKRSVKRALGDD